MAKFNTSFELSIDDLDLIETALRRKKRVLSEQRLTVATTKAGPTTEAEMLDSLDDKLRSVHELLGRLHNQKVFYRPSGSTYVGG